MLGLEQGFETPDLAVIGEQDILGDRLVRPRRKARSAADVITEATSLAVGDLVVHADHGIGRFDGLDDHHRARRAARLPRARLCRRRQALSCRSRTSSCCRATAPTRRRAARPARRRRLAARKARLKQRLREIAAELIKIAALRQLQARRPSWRRRTAPTTSSSPASPTRRPRTRPPASRPCWTTWPPASPMDRLVCGDVGFGKTEVALRAAFVAAHDGLQVAVVVPTTLLARQHFATFTERFKGLPVRIAQASRLVGGQGRWPRSRPGSSDGTIDIVVGTHALLGKAIDFKRPRPADRRRGAALRRRPQGAAEAAARGRARADADRDADPAHAAAGADRRARAVADHHAAGRPAGGAHLHLAVRSGRSSARRCCASATAAGRASTSCRASPTSTRSPSSCARQCRSCSVARAHGQLAPTRARRRHDRLLRRQVRRAAVDRHRRIRPRHPQRQHADRPPRRHVRPGPALSAARPRRPLQGARLRLLHDARRPEAHRGRREAPEGAAVARHAGRRLLAGQPRPRHPRRRQPAGRGAVRPHPRGRLRALPVDAGGGGRGAEGRRPRRGAGAVEPADLARHRRC